MDRGKIIETLGLVEEGVFSVTGVQLVQWGREVILDFEYVTIAPDKTLEAPVLFSLIFRDCREMRWKMYAHIALAEMGEIAARTSLAEISIGHGAHRRDANILTAHFGLTISYGELMLSHNEQHFTLPT